MQTLKSLLKLKVTIGG